MRKKQNPILVGLMWDSLVGMDNQDSVLNILHLEDLECLVISKKKDY